ncbi:MAG: hypothetical protein HYX66_00715 [Ignavibacteria bacterium]|nr:hypothetical protein [Ignavibacteria bacterium]
MQKGATLIVFFVALTTARPGESPKIFGGSSVGYVRLSVPTNSSGVFALPTNSNSYPASIGFSYDFHAGSSIQLSSLWNVGLSIAYIKSTVNLTTTEPTLFNVGGEPTPGSFTHTLDFNWAFVSPALSLGWTPTKRFAVDVVGSVDFPTTAYGTAVESISDPDGVTYTNGDTSRVRISATEPAKAAVSIAARFQFPFDVSSSVSIIPFIGVRQQLTSFSANTTLLPTRLSLGIDAAWLLLHDNDLPASALDTLHNDSIHVAPPDTSESRVTTDTLRKHPPFLATALDVSLQTSGGAPSSSIKILTKRKLILKSSQAVPQDASAIGDKGIDPVRVIADTVVDADPPLVLVRSRSIADAGIDTGTITGFVANRIVWYESWSHKADTTLKWELTNLPGDVLMSDTLELVLQSTATDLAGGSAQSIPRSIVLYSERIDAPVHADSIAYLTATFTESAFDGDSLSFSGKGLVNALRPFKGKLKMVSIAGPQDLINIVMELLHLTEPGIIIQQTAAVTINSRLE